MGAHAGGSPRRGCPRWRFTPRNEREIVLSRMLRILRAPQGEFLLLVKYAIVWLQLQAKDARIKSFFGPAIFSKNAGEESRGRGALWSTPASRRNTLRHAYDARRKGVRNATAFRGGSEQDRFPLLNRRSKVRPAKHPGGMFCTTCGVAPAGGSPRETNVRSFCYGHCVP